MFKEIITKILLACQITGDQVYSVIYMESEHPSKRLEDHPYYTQIETQLTPKDIPFATDDELYNIIKYRQAVNTQVELGIADFLIDYQKRKETPIDSNR